MKDSAKWEETIVRQALEVSKLEKEKTALEEKNQELQERLSRKEEEISDLRPVVQIYDSILAAVKRCFLDGYIPLPAIVAAKKAVPVVTVGAPECGALSGMRILPFQVTYKVDGSTYDANFVLVPALEPVSGLNEIFPHYKAAQWVAEKKPSVRGKKKTKLP